MSIPSAREAAYEMLGHCPQEDPVWAMASGRDHLLFYGRIKGVPEAQLNDKVNTLLTRLGFEDADKDKIVKTYSGGMRRKLSVGIALIGQSKLLFLDEPSCAVDAAAKRHLWKVLRRRAPNQTVVMTTHSMEEAEAICDRIAIQVKGQLRCLGTPTHIKAKYGSGYQFEIDSPARTEEEMTAFLHREISPDASLIEHHSDRFLYQLPAIGNGGLSLGTVFSKMQANKDTMNIIDYSISRPSLEQVFLRMAKDQLEDATAEEQPVDRSGTIQPSQGQELQQIIEE